MHHHMLRIRTASLACLLPILYSSVVGAQATPRSTRAAPDSSTLSVQYPEMLRVAGTSGSIRFQVPVSTFGRAEMAGFTVLRADNELFRISVKSTLPRWRFTPRVLNDSLAVDTLLFEVHFVVPSESVVRTGPSKRRLSSSATGEWTLSVGWPDAGADSASVPRDSATASLIRAATFKAILSEIESSDTLLPARIACISESRRLVVLEHSGRETVGSSSTALLAQLARPRLAVVDARRCPPTFASMVALVDEQRRPLQGAPPPGEDPWHVQIGGIRPWSGNAAIVHGAVEHGTSGRAYKCGVTRVNASSKNWTATCASSQWHVH